MLSFMHCNVLIYLKIRFSLSESEKKARHFAHFPKSLKFQQTFFRFSFECFAPQVWKFNKLRERKTKLWQRYRSNIINWCTEILNSTNGILFLTIKMTCDAVWKKFWQRIWVNHWNMRCRWRQCSTTKRFLIATPLPTWKRFLLQHFVKSNHK